MKDKEEFKRQLLEKLIFENEKDNALICAKRIKSKYQSYDLDFTKIYAKLINYQIKKFGYPLGDPRVVINLYFAKRKGIL